MIHCAILGAACTQLIAVDMEFNLSYNGIVGEWNASMLQFLWS